MPSNGPKQDEPDPDEFQDITSAERVLLDLHRARRQLGKDFGRPDPRAQYYLKRAKFAALLEIGLALRELAPEHERRDEGS